MTLNEIAAAAGVSKMAVSKKNLPHIKNPNGTLYFDPENIDVKNYINRTTRNREVARRNKGSLIKKTKTTTIRSQTEKKTTDNYASGEDEDYRNMILKNKKLELDIGKTRGDLIPVTLVERWIKHLFDADTTALKVIADRIGSNVAMLARGAEDEATAGNLVRNLINDEMSRVLAGIKRVQKDFKKSIEPGLFDRVETVDESEQEAV